MHTLCCSMRNAKHARELNFFRELNFAKTKKIIARIVINNYQ